MLLGAITCPLTDRVTRLIFSVDVASRTGNADYICVFVVPFGPGITDNKSHPLGVIFYHFLIS